MRFLSTLAAALPKLVHEQDDITRLAPPCPITSCQAHVAI